MTYQATYCPPGEGAELFTVDADVTVKCFAAATGGTYEIFEVDMPRGADVPPHREPWPKAFYVLHGRLSVRVDDAVHDIGPGGFVSIPPDTANSFHAITPTVRFLAFSLGERLGNFFVDIDRTVTRGEPFEQIMPKMLELADRHEVRLMEQSAVTS